VLLRVDFKSLFVDTLVGLSAFSGYALLRILANVGYDVRETLVIAAILFLPLGFVRGISPPSNPWTKGGLIAAVGCGVAYLTLALSLLLGSLFFLTSFLLVVCGIRARRSYDPKSPSQCVMLLAIPMIVVATAVTVVPLFGRKLQESYPYALAPAFSFSTLDGRLIKSSEFRGHVVVLSFWATWCGPCLAELPELERLYRCYKGDRNIIIWAVDLANNDDPGKAQDLFRSKGYEIPLALDSQRSRTARFDTNAIPVIYVLDRRGRIRHTYRGYTRTRDLVAELSTKIDALIVEK
jgi:thiol-disulfide isomerase/thioredoxin